ncbi:MAG: glutathione S-transferase family protein [Rhizobiaceae bacterium]|nr:glutathione S-transferase family protein [Rhizobiaceae bacterium]
MKLYIGNKKYSSWSLRPWLALKVRNIPFEEVLVPFDMEAGNPEFRKFSPTGKVPCLLDGDLTVWESLAILEYVADKHPEAHLWPAGIAERAIARAVAHEMHGGFGALRNSCPMNMSREPSPIDVPAAVHADAARIEQLWSECLQKSGGPFLFGEFTNVDAMYAPVVNRLEIYCLGASDAVQQYSNAMKSLEAWKEWEQAGRAETWYVAEDEV